MTPSPHLTLAVAAGGAVGALLRHGLEMWVPDGAGFPWTTLAINVVGAFLLALLPALARVRRSPAWTVALGPGVLGGFTTLSAASEQARALLADERLAAASAYALGTLVACLAAVLLAGLLSARVEQDVVARAGGDE
ncbi:CrcB family protein [Nocardioides sp.]|uniref:fluoride efflux transporter FluC n=1 Tax=Nocardioides sp. TaxID=35761 RepID=UPI002B272F6C|nr:CrcB family protein [Nocardioides sp.]